MIRVVGIEPGVYRVEMEGRAETVYVAGPPHDRWAFWNGVVFRTRAETSSPRARRAAGGQGTLSVSAPMPATVVRVLVKPGDTVRHGDTLIVLEAMKMELPLRAPGDATVKAVHCREGEMVQPETDLVELE